MAPEAPTVSDPLIHTTVVVPAFNEEEALPVVLEKVLAAVDAGYEVLVVDDGSTDGTRAVAGRFNCRLIAYETNRGKAAAMRIGIREARGENVIFIDADDTYPADIIPQIVSELSAFDMVVCSRAGGHANIPAFNRIGNAIFRNSIRYLYNFPAYDPLTGFYGVKRRHLLPMDLRSEGFRIESEIAIKAARMGLEIHDIPIRYRPRLGQAKLRGLQDGYTIFATIISMLPLYCPTFLQLFGQNALIYGLFIVVISRQESSLATSAFVLAAVIPSIVLSVPGGLIADLLPKKLVLLTVLALRLLIAWLFIDLDLAIGAALGLTFLTWTAYQFFTPAENAAIVAIVPSGRIPQAVSLLQALSLAAQLAGAGLLAPLAVKLLNADGLFAAVILLFLASGALYAVVPHLSPPRGKLVRQEAWWRALPSGLRILAADADLARITALRVLVDTGTLVVIVAAPAFIEDTLATGAENAVYIAMPAALGIAMGLLIALLLLVLFSPRLLVALGFFLFASTVLALPLVDALWRGLFTELGFSGLEQLTGLDGALIATVLLLPWAGLGVSLVQVAARTSVYSRVPTATIAQVFATQSAIGSVAALLPTFLTGALLDVLPVKAVLLAFGGLLILLAIAAWQRLARISPSPPTAAAV